MTQLLVLESPCDAAVTQITQALTGRGLRTIHSFNLHSALTTQTACPCPHHGTNPCDCQMVVMLVYGTADSPATLVAHGHNGRTWLILIDTPEQHPSPDLTQAIFETLLDALPVDE